MIENEQETKVTGEKVGAPIKDEFMGDGPGMPTDEDLKKGQEIVETQPKKEGPTLKQVLEMADRMMRDIKGPDPKDEVRSPHQAKEVGLTVVQIQSAEKEISELAKRAKAHIDQVVASKMVSLQSAKTGLYGNLIKWATVVLKGEKRKSRVFKEKMVGDSGKEIEVTVLKIGFRSTSGKLEIVDPKKAIAYCEEHDLPIRVKKEIDKKALKAFAQDNAEFDNDAFKLAPPVENFYVE